MRAREYLDRLSGALGALEAAEREDFLREMESHIDGLRERRAEVGEEELIAGLTPPESLAAELIGEGGAEEAVGSGATKPRNEAKGEGSGQRARRGPAEQLRSALESLSRLAELGGSLGAFSRRAREGGSGEVFDQSFPAADLEAISLRVESAEVSLRRGDSASLRLRVGSEDLGGRLIVSLEEGLLSLVERQGGGSPLEELRVELPRGLASVEIRTMSGEVRCEGIETERLSVVTTSGDVEISDLEGDCLLESVSGDLDVRGCGSISATTASGEIRILSARGDVAAKSSSGDLLIEEVEGDAAAETANGDIVLRDVEGRLGVKSVTGELSLEDCRGQIGIMTSSGSIDLSCPVDFGDLSASTVSGDLSLHLPPEAEAEIHAVSKTGTVRIGEREGSRLDLIRGAGGRELRLSSLSGDVTVDW